MLSNNLHRDENAEGLCCASQLAASSSSCRAAPRRNFAFLRAWILRRAEIQVLAERADCRCQAARKRIVMADTTMFAERKEPSAEIEDGETVKDVLANYLKMKFIVTIIALIGLFS